MVFERFGIDRITKAPKRLSGNAVQAISTVPKASTQDIAAKTAQVRTWLVRTLLSHLMLYNGAYELKFRLNGPYLPMWEPRYIVPEEVVSRYIRVC